MLPFILREAKYFYSERLPKPRCCAFLSRESRTRLGKTLNAMLRAGWLTMAAVLLMAITALSSQSQTNAAPANTAQPNTEIPVPVAREPHHHFVFENSYARAFRVNIPENGKTLLHQHDFPYVYVSLGPADIINAVVGKPEVHLKLLDGQAGYAKAPLVHVARAAGIPFNNVTIELLQPQGEPENLCAQALPGASAGPCDKTEASSKSRSFSIEPLMKTDATQVDLIRFEGEKSVVALEPDSLLVGLDDPGIEIRFGNDPPRTLRTGEVLWVGSDANAQVANPQKKAGRYLQLTFKHAVNP